MKLALVTPSLGRPKAFALLERWMAAQTQPPFEWIVCGEGGPYDFKAPVRFVDRRQIQCGNLHSICENIWHGLNHVSIEADGVLIICDDDWYGPTYLEVMDRELSRPEVEACGVMPSLWYSVRTKRLVNVSARGYPDLGTIGFRRRALPWVQGVAARGNAQMDSCFWKNFGAPTAMAYNDRLHLGIKGLPGLPTFDPFAASLSGAQDDGTVLAAITGEESAELLLSAGKKK